MIVGKCTSIQAAHKSILLILLVDKKHLIIILLIYLRLYINSYKPEFTRFFIIDD